MSQYENDNSEEKTERERIVEKIESIKSEIKIIFTCSIIGLVIGTIIAVVAGVINRGGVLEIVTVVIVGMWAGNGIGGSVLPFLLKIPGLFMYMLRKDGFIKAITTGVIGGFWWIIIYSIIGILGGPICILVMVLKRKYQIKKLQKELL